MTAEIRLHHFLSTEECERLEDTIRDTIEEEFDQQVDIVSEATGNELTANPDKKNRYEVSFEEEFVTEADSHNEAVENIREWLMENFQNVELKAERV